MGKFVVKTTANGGFKFDLKAGNGEIIASSQIYKSEKSCNAGIEQYEYMKRFMSRLSYISTGETIEIQ